MLLGRGPSLKKIIFIVFLKKKKPKFFGPLPKKICKDDE